MGTQAIETASALIRAIGTDRDRVTRAYLLSMGRFADLITLADQVSARTALRGRVLSLAS